MAAGEQESTGARTEPPASSRASPGRGKPNEAVMRALVEVEQTLARLKQVRAERADEEARYKAELAERDRRETELLAERDHATAQLAEAQGRLGSLEAERDGANAARAELARLQGVERELRDGLEQAVNRIGALEAEASTIGAESERWRNEAQAAAGELDRLRAQVGSLEGELQALRQQSDSAAATHANAAAEHQVALQGLEAELARVRAELAESADRLGATSADLAESAQNAGILSGKIEEQTATINELHAALEASRAELNAHRGGEGAAAAEVGRLSSELDLARTEVERLKGLCEAAVESERAAKAAAEERAGAFEATREQLEAQLAAAQATIAELHAGSEADGALRAELESLRAQLAAAASRTDAPDGAGGETAALLGAKQEEIESLRQKLDLAAERLLELQAVLEERDELLASGGADQAELARVRDELARTKSELASARTGQKRRGRAAESDDAARMAQRQHRLSRLRRALRERRAQSDKASAILAERVKLCDELLARRRELAEAREVIERTHRKVVGERARSGGAAVIFFSVGLLVVLAGASWAVVSHFFPATYAATAVLAADFRGGTPAPEEPGAWQQFHEQLLEDPQLIGRVAERMRQRGFETLGAPAAVKAMLDSSLTWSSPQPGKLVLELRGVGSEATARMLDVYTTTLELETNALRQRRSDSAETIIAERARSGNEPVLDERPARAAIGLGIASLLSLLTWTGIWRRMVKTKQAFENPERIDHLLEEARWVDPIQKIIASHPERSPTEGRAA